MKAIVIFTEEYVYGEFQQTTIDKVILISDEDLKKVNVDDILFDGEKCEIVNVTNGFVDTKTIHSLRWE